MFNINDLCPNNAPRRCIECKGPYHIRKRCPKLISLANEKEKAKRVTVPNQQITNNNQYEIYRNNPQYPFYQQYYYPPQPNFYHHPLQMPPHQRIWTQPYSNDRPIIYSTDHHHYYQHQHHQQQPHHQQHQQQHQQINNSNRSYYSNNPRRKTCYLCGSANHLQTQCTQFQR